MDGRRCFHAMAGELEDEWVLGAGLAERSIESRALRSINPFARPECSSDPLEIDRCIGQFSRHSYSFDSSVIE